MPIKNQKAVIVGAGFTGLSAAYYLSKNNPDLEIVIVEKEGQAGGLAGGFKLKNWTWSLDYFYHHLFTSDKDVLELLNRLGLADMVKFKLPKTSLFIKQKKIKFDSPQDVITYPFLNFFNKLYLGSGLAFLKLWPFGLKLEAYTTAKFLPKIIGQPAYQQIFAPLLKSKFDRYAGRVNLAWFWARIKSRSRQLGYPQGGFAHLASRLVDKLQNQIKVEFQFHTKVTSIASHDQTFELKTDKGKTKADIIVLTSPPETWQNYNLLTKNYYQSFIKDKSYLSAQTLILRLNKRFFDDKTYWLNINQTEYPFLIVAEHTNFIAKKYYNNQHLVYIGNYLPLDHKYLNYEPTQLLKEFWPYLTKISPGLKKHHLIDCHLFQARFGQPVMPVGYSKEIPPLKVGSSNLYIANMLQVYPYDRGINYAVKLGRRLARFITNDRKIV